MSAKITKDKYGHGVNKVKLSVAATVCFYGGFEKITEQ